MTCKVPGCPEPEHAAGPWKFVELGSEGGSIYAATGSAEHRLYPVAHVARNRPSMKVDAAFIAATPARTHALVKLVAACFREHITVNDQPMGVLVCIECRTLKGSPHDSDCAVGTALAEAEAALK